ncbi:hypothetical protein SCP_0114510 [Sparassis crispa]|uniref:Uncharacterized protein n=1 Tax=Sparassis crispa TaxID=139825 RepID=A0A401G8S9_9APHY|nr:hypothetical protein SCP_0114510 [Sparassis crispa]GBE78562.1 hypothetical protein SCP_0114510 [Sparassis crispa]
MTPPLQERGPHSSSSSHDARPHLLPPLLPPSHDRRPQPPNGGHALQEGTPDDTNDTPASRAGVTRGIIHSDLPHLPRMLAALHPATDAMPCKRAHQVTRMTPPLQERGRRSLSSLCDAQHHPQ